jgi:integrase
MVANALREWRLACPRSDLDLVLPDRRGRPLSHSSIVRCVWHPAQVAGGIVDTDGRANRRADGGLELPIKVVQGRLGHASIQMTADRYGHLFPRGDDSAELAAAERAFMGS